MAAPTEQDSYPMPIDTTHDDRNGQSCIFTGRLPTVDFGTPAQLTCRQCSWSAKCPTPNWTLGFNSIKAWHFHLDCDYILQPQVSLREINSSVHDLEKKLCCGTHEDLHRPYSNLCNIGNRTLQHWGSIGNQGWDRQGRNTFCFYTMCVWGVCGGGVCACLCGWRCLCTHVAGSLRWCFTGIIYLSPFLSF